LEIDVLAPPDPKAELPGYRNDGGVPEVRVPVRQFKCIGVSPPHDHPHIYLDMGEHDAIVCPYCSTRFLFYEPQGERDSAAIDAAESEGWPGASDGVRPRQLRLALEEPV
jgi:uncharacterized Zn-finger protein